MRLEFQPQAVRDLEGIGDYIADDNPVRAVTFIRELRSHCHLIEQTPLAYPLRSDIATGIRSAAYGRYVIYFTVDKDVVRIIRVLHGAMDATSHLKN